MIHIDKTWTLFLDRDGVINKRIPGGYVLNWEQFEFLEGAKEAISIFSKKFGRIVVVTNQQGIGKGLMTPEDLEHIHQNMLREVEHAGGHIHRVYFCPDLASLVNHTCRKPNPDMALQAKRDFPEIDFIKSVMAGDSLTDMQFGHRLGMVNVLIETKSEEKGRLMMEMEKQGLEIHFRFEGLWDFRRSWGLSQKSAPEN